MSENAGRLRELALLFLKLGTTAFGGPAAHIAMMEEEFVRRRQWLSREKFLDLLGATNLIPGPNSTEMAIHIGHLRAGFPGLVVAGVCFILPVMLIVMSIGWAYVRYGSLPELQGILYGVKPVIIAVVVQALWVLTRTAVKSKLLAVAGVLALGLTLAQLNELLVLLITRLLVAFFGSTRGSAMGAVAVATALGPIGALANSMPSGVSFSVERLFLFFLKAIGQFTPGPVCGIKQLGLREPPEPRNETGP